MGQNIFGEDNTIAVIMIERMFMTSRIAYHNHGTVSTALLSRKIN